MDTPIYQGVEETRPKTLTQIEEHVHELRRTTADIEAQLNSINLALHERLNKVEERLG